MNETEAEFSRIAKDALVRAEEAEAEVKRLQLRERKLYSILNKVEAMQAIADEVQSELQTLCLSRGEK